jgi:hypothetical protein
MRRRLYRRIVSVSAIGMLVGLAPGRARTQPTAETYKTWSGLIARQPGMQLCRRGTFQYDARQARAFFSVFKQTGDDLQRLILVVSWGSLEEKTRAFRTPKEAEGPLDCPPPPGTWESGRDVRLGPWGTQPREFVRISVVDDQLVVLHENDEDASQSSGISWEELAGSSRSYEDHTETGEALLLLLDAKSPWQARLPAPQNWVIFGKGNHRGPEDAQVTARVELSGQTLLIRMSARDDVARPLASSAVSDAAFLKADHFELWFCARNKGDVCGKKEARQLGVARTADGQLHERWLHPKGNKEPLPALSAEGTAVTVSLPLDRIQHKEGHRTKLEGKLTVVYSDSDAEGKGQESAVATSLLKWGNADSFGRYVRLEAGARFPPFDGGAGFSESETLLESLPKPPW